VKSLEGGSCIRHIKGALKQILFGLILTHNIIAWAQPIDLTADQVERGKDGILSANGHVEAKRGDETIQADRLRYDPNQSRLEAKGHVVIISPRGEIHAASGELSTANHTGTLQQAEMGLPDGARLYADELERLNLTTFKASHSRFTTCPADEEAWSLRAEHVVLDQGEGELTARNTRFYIGGIPVLYSPYWHEPLRRKSGFLTPFFANGKRRGTELALPYYLALAPDWDATLTPHWMSARGIQPELELRHVSAIGSELLQGEWLNDDVLKRGRSRIRATTAWNTPFSTMLTVDADHISDRDYLADLSSDFNDASKRYLQSQAEFSRQQDANEWSLLVRHQQDLTTPNNAATLRVLPRLENRFLLPLFGNRILLHFDHQTTRFDRRLGTDGWRLNIHPYVELPLWASTGAASIKLFVGVRHTRYWLRDTQLARKPFLTSVETGVEASARFEKMYANGSLRHSIEPTLRYDLVGVGDQSQLPNFDSAFGRLTVGNLLSSNRFAGTDRIESAHRISLLLGNRLEAKTDGAPRTLMLAKMGISYNLRRRQIDPAVRQRNRLFSNLIADAVFNPTSSMSLYIRGQYDPSDKFLATAQAGADWLSSVGHELHVAYRLTDARYVSAEEQSINVSAMVRVAQRWRILGGWYYNIISHTTQQASIGGEYQHPCWQVRLEGFRLNRASTSAAGADVGVRFMLAFKGLGSIGN